MSSRPRMARGFVAVIGALALLALSAAEAVAAEDGEKHGDWIVKCRDTETDKTSTCVLAQALKRKNGEKLQLVMSTFVGRFGPDKEPGMVISVPLGVFLPAGLIVAAGSGTAAERLDFEFCNRTGCRALLRLDRRWLDLFRSAAKANVTIRNRRQREIKIPLSLKGFSKGVAAIGIGR